MRTIATTQLKTIKDLREKHGKGNMPPSTTALSYPLWICIALGALASPSFAQTENAKVAATFNSRELIVLFDDSAASDAATADEIVDAIRNPTTNARSLALSSRLNNPISARHLIRERPALETAGDSAKKISAPNAESPETLLPKYVVIGFGDELRSSQAYEQLRQDPRVRWVGANRVIRPSVTPADPFATQSFVGFNYGRRHRFTNTAWRI